MKTDNEKQATTARQNVAEGVVGMAEANNPERYPKRLAVAHLAILAGAGRGDWAVRYYRTFMEDDASDEELLADWKTRCPKSWADGETQNRNTRNSKQEVRHDQPL